MELVMDLLGIAVGTTMVVVFILANLGKLK